VPLGSLADRIRRRHFSGVRDIQRPSNPANVFGWCGSRFEGGAVATLFALDRQLGDIVRTTEQPIVGQMRLTWWYEALTRLDREPPPAQPLLQDLAVSVITRGVEGRALAAMTEGWEILLDDERRDTGALVEVARRRGATLFRAAGVLVGENDRALDDAGIVWALADLAVNVSDVGVRERARAAAIDLARQTFATRWSGARVLGALALDARAAMLGRGVANGPRRAALSTRFRMIGR
jgi:phytoene synthase